MSQPAPTTRTRDATSILVLDDDSLVQRLVQRFLESDGHQVSTAGSLAEAHALVEDSAPGAFDAAVVDVDLPDGRGFEFIKAMRASQSPAAPTAFIVISGNPDDVALNESVQEGILEFIFKPFSSAELRSSVRRAVDSGLRWRTRLAALEGGVVAQSDEATPSKQVTSGKPSRGLPAPLDQLSVDRGLTEREQEALRLVVAGYQNAEIAEALSISANTVKYHVRNTFSKLGVESRTDLFLTLLQDA